MHIHSDSDRPSILSYLQDPDLPSRLIESFFQAAIDYVDARPWARLLPTSHFPILLDFYSLSPRLHRMALIMGGPQSGGDALGLVLCEGLPPHHEDDGDHPGSGYLPPSPALTVIYAGYPEPGLMPISWRGQPLPLSRTGLLAWPTVHAEGDRARAPRRFELALLTTGLCAVREFVSSYPAAVLDDEEVHPHECEVQVDGLPGRVDVRATPFPIPH